MRDGIVEVRSRGFGRKETSFDAIKAAYDADPMYGTYRYKTTRFVGIGGALARKDFWQFFARWVAMERTIYFNQSKRIAVDEANGIVTYMPMLPPVGQTVSKPYTPKTRWDDMWQTDDDEQLADLLDYEQP